MTAEQLAWVGVHIALLAAFGLLCAWRATAEVERELRQAREEARLAERRLAGQEARALRWRRAAARYRLETIHLRRGTTSAPAPDDEVSRMLDEGCPNG